METAAAIREMGRDLGPAVLLRSQALYDAEQRALSRPTLRTVDDAVYGPHERQRLDVYRPLSGDGARPIVVWVHGGGFLRGEKRADDHPFSAHVGEFVARHGYSGIVINYRLAPEHRWPSGAQDLALVLQWIRANVAIHGGDPQQIVLAGTSAGAAHVASLLRVAGLPEGLRGLILMSGLYGLTEPEARDLQYLPAAVAEYRSAEAVADCGLPLLISCAQWDPPRFQRESLELAQTVLARRGVLPGLHTIADHNHYTAALHLGSGDGRFNREFIDFVRGCTDPA